MEDVILAEGFQGQLWLEESKKVKKHVAVEEFVQKRTSANDKTSTNPSVVIAEPPTHEPAANEVYSAL